MIDWDSIDTVLLDMDGTLLDLHFDNFFWTEHIPREYARRNNLPEQEASDALLARISQNRGTLEWYCVDYWSEQLDLDIPALKRELKHMVKLRPHVPEFLDTLRAGAQEVVLVTNAHRKTLDIKMEQVDITPWFHRIVVSHELAAAKEDQAFWHALQDHHPFDPARTLLIDDTETVLDAAQTYGIAHLLTLLQPDSQRQKRIDTRFPGIHHFDEIMPGAARTS
ncbi:GMP/IMP nucleotidase [Parahaliea aestuarii]|uniref:GMP/IMP nucleotidase n=1 Tax=Parahaliea aestuarii TaxID=1852021 RepID=A0A5C9A3M7_9GAMM|nr:GMP/IMP nucleotidase [Parahaliea aestuarii]TXS94542.1 GMP/IMP nucleotidase [Parahaliea aestuarii]